MTMLPGLIALALIGAANSPGPEPGVVVTQFRLMEMDGLAWRENVSDQFDLVGRQGPATVWTADKQVLPTLTALADRTLVAPKVTSRPEATASISAQVVRHYVAQLGRIADGPINHATHVAYPPDVQPLHDGFEARIACRPTEKGILARVDLDDAWFIAFHTAKRSETLVTNGNGDTPTDLTSQYQVPEVANCRVAGEWLIPKEGILVISLGARTVPVEKLLGTRAEVRERIAIIDCHTQTPSESTEQPASPATDHVASSLLESPDGATCPVLPNPGTIGGDIPPVAPAVCTFEAIGPGGIKAFAFGPPAGSPIAPMPLHAGVLHGVVVPMPVPMPPPTAYPVFRWRLPVVPSIARLVSPVPATIVAPPMPARIPAPNPASERNLAKAPADRTVTTASTSESPKAPTPAPVEVNTMDDTPMPKLPSRTLPQAFDTEGEPVTLPPLPDETAEALAYDELHSGTSEPKPSPQSRGRQSSPSGSTTLAAIEAPTTGTIESTSGTIELKGRVTIRTPDGLVIEADSIVLKPPTASSAKERDASVRPTAASGVPIPMSVPTCADESPTLPFLDEDEECDLEPLSPAPCSSAPHPPAACSGNPAACRFQNSTGSKTPCASAVDSCLDDGSSRSVWSLTLPSAIRIATANAPQKGSAGILERLLTNKGITTDGRLVEVEVGGAWLARSVIHAYANLFSSYKMLWTCEAAFEVTENVLAGLLADDEMTGNQAGDRRLPDTQAALEAARLKLVESTSNVLTAERELRQVMGLPACDNRRIATATDLETTQGAAELSACLALMKAQFDGRSRFQRDPPRKGRGHSGDPSRPRRSVSLAPAGSRHERHPHCLPGPGRHDRG